MEKFSAVKFYQIGGFVRVLEVLLDKHSPDERMNPGTVKDADAKQNILGDIRSNCEQIGLHTSIKCVDHILRRDGDGIAVGEMRELLAQLNRTIKWEMEE